MQHAHSAAAIAMALSNVGHCSKKLGIEKSEYTDPETKEDFIILSFNCSSNAEDEGSAFLFFPGIEKSGKIATDMARPRLENLNLPDDAVAWRLLTSRNSQLRGLARATCV